MLVGSVAGEYIYDEKCNTKNEELFVVLNGTLYGYCGKVIFSLQDGVYLVVRAATLKPKHTPI